MNTKSLKAVTPRGHTGSKRSSARSFSIKLLGDFLNVLLALMFLKQEFTISGAVLLTFVDTVSIMYSSCAICKSLIVCTLQTCRIPIRGLAFYLAV